MNLKSENKKKTITFQEPNTSTLLKKTYAQVVSSVGQQECVRKHAEQSGAKQTSITNQIPDPKASHT